MTYHVSISDPVVFSVFDLKGRRDALAAMLSGLSLPDWPSHHNHLTRKADRKLLWIGHEHWLIISPIGDEEALSRVINGNAFSDESTILPVSDIYAFISITGADAEEIISVCSPIDHHPSVFGQDAATFTEFFGLKALLFREDDGFMIAIDRSYADFMIKALAQIAFGS